MVHQGTDCRAGVNRFATCEPVAAEPVPPGDDARCRERSREQRPQRIRDVDDQPADFGGRIAQARREQDHVAETLLPVDEERALWRGLPPPLGPWQREPRSPAVSSRDSESAHPVANSPSASSSSPRLVRAAAKFGLSASAAVNRPRARVDLRRS